MRQVPLEVKTDFRPLLLGRGKLARHLQHYFKFLSIPFESWENARDLKSSLFLESFARSNAVWILVSDGAIASVYQELKALSESFARSASFSDSKKCFLHSSAATSVPGTLTVHPLMTFGPEMYDEETYGSIPLVRFQEEEKWLTPSVSLLLSSLPNPLKVLPSEQRGFYHAACVMMSNFPLILWNEVSKQSEEALHLQKNDFHPIIEQTLHNFLTLGASALTGPLVRNDQETQKNNQESLLQNTAQGEALAKLYQAFVSFYETTQKEGHHDHGSRI